MREEVDPDSAWVAALTGQTERAAKRALQEVAGKAEPFPQIDAEHRWEGRNSYIEIDAPMELYALARLLRPLHIVEVGVSSGVSSAYFLAALAANGHGTLHSIDLPSFEKSSARRKAPRSSWSLPPGRAPGWAIPPSLRGQWDLHLGEMSDLVPRLASELPRIGLVLYDVPHRESEVARELTALDPHLTPKCPVIVDHGPTGGSCRALQQWARQHRSSTIRRRGWGLSAARRGMSR
jgi:cephalosporin hydroxylase